MDLSKEFLLALNVSQLIGICVLVWKMATIYSEFNYRVEKNQNDINGLAKRFEERMNYNYSVVNNRINHLAQHLERTDQYHPPTFDNYSD